MPIFARIEVKAAKKADNSANIIHMMSLWLQNYISSIKMRAVSGRETAAPSEAQGIARSCRSAAGCAQISETAGFNRAGPPVGADRGPGQTLFLD
jgi:hypothetical protein